LPYDVSTSRLADASRIIHEQAPLPPRTANPDVNPALETVLLQALHKERQRRYQSAAMLAEDVRRVLNGQTIVARQDSTTYVLLNRTRLGISKHRVVSAFFAAVLALLVAEIVGAQLDGAFDVSPRFDRFAMRHLTAFPELEFPNVKMIAFSNSTDSEALARRVGIDLRRDATRRWRRVVTGKVLQRLTVSGAKAVVLDHFYADASTNREDDHILIEGI